MKKSLLAASAAALFALQQPAHALVGLGVSYGRNFTSINGGSSTVASADLPASLQAYADDAGVSAPELRATSGDIDGLQQIGLKAWLDLPLIPIEFEAAANLAWGSYASSTGLYAPDSTLLLDVDTHIDPPIPVPGVKSGETPYTQIALDLSARYAFLKLPPLSPLKPFKLYAGGGVSWFYTSKVITASDAAEILDGATVAGKSQAEAQKILAKKLSDDFYESRIGGHLLVGAQLKIPVLPVAFFVDGKWYFNAATSDKATQNPFAVSGGVAFAL